MTCLSKRNFRALFIDHVHRLDIRINMKFGLLVNATVKNLDLLTRTAQASAKGYATVIRKLETKIWCVENMVVFALSLLIRGNEHI